MIGSKPRFPKRARYPLFVLGLAVMILGDLVLYWLNAPEGAIVLAAAVGFVLMVSSVLFK